MLREYYEMNEAVKYPETFVEYIIQKQWKPIESVVKNYTVNENSNVKKTK